MTLTSRILFISVCLSALAGSSHGQTFNDIAPDQGIELVNPTADYGCGVSFADFDMDGWDDITLGTKNSPIRFYRNNQGTFEQINLSGINIFNKEIKQITWVDFDNDGDRDLFVGIMNDPFRIYVNNGDMTFTQIGGASGINSGSYANRNICWADYDRDGDLDVYLSRSNAIGSGNFDQDYPLMNHLYRNDDGYFVDVTMEAGVSDSIGITYGTVWWDYDHDGWPDLYVVNDKWFKNALYHNNGDGTFSDVGPETGLDVVMDGMCASPADYDNDGDFDMYVTNTYLALDGAGNALFRNDNGYYINSAPTEGVNTSVFQSWGAGWLDYDNDGWQDLYVSTRETFPNYPGMNRMYRNNQGSGFSIVNSSTGLSDDQADAFVNAIGDINNDGYPDIISQPTSPFPARIFQSSGGENHYLKVELEGVVSNKEGIGSLISCYTDGDMQVRYTTCGENYMAQNSFVEIFGIGDHSFVDSLIVEWSSGHVDRFYNLDIDQKLEILEGSSLSIELTATGTINQCEGESFEIGVIDYSDVEWSTGLNASTLSVTESGSYYAIAYTDLGVPILSEAVEVIFNPTPEIEETITNVSCNGQTDGQIELTTTTSNAISVLWGDGPEGVIRADLEPGYYTYSAEDEYGCASSGLVQITEPEELLFNAISTGSCDSDSTGTITIETLNHIIDNVQWDNSEIEGSELSGLVPGTYIGTIVYLENCVTTTQLEVSAYPQISVEEVFVQNVLCNGESNGSIALTIDESIELSDLSWSNGVNGIEETTNLNLSPGIYEFTAVNTYGCIQTESIEISEPEDLQAEILSSPVLDIEDECYATYNNTATVSGGTEPYEYLWTHVFLGESTQWEEQSWNCVGAGWLNLNITDSNGCIFNSAMNLEIVNGIEEISESVHIYPNPAIDKINILGLSQKLKVEIFSMDGRLIKSYTAFPNESIDIAELSSGQYLLKINATKHQINKIFFKH